MKNCFCIVNIDSPAVFFGKGNSRTDLPTVSDTIYTNSLEDAIKAVDLMSSIKNITKANIEMYFDEQTEE